MMKFASSSSSSLQLFAAAAATEARMSSSSRASSRGGRDPFTWSRGFCDRPPKRGRDAFVSGDSHLRSVRDANYSARQGDGGSFSNSGGGGGYQGQPFYPPPHFHQPRPNSHQQQPIYPPPHFHPNSHQQQPFYPPPYFHQPRPNSHQQQPFYPPPHFHQPQPNAHHGQPFYPPPHIRQPLPNTHNGQPLYPPPPHFRQPLPIRPQRKALDHRNWEYALSQPPSDCERFVVLSYNILADYLALKHRHELYFHIPRHILDWEWRREKIVRELGLWSPDILCLQEVDRFQDLEEPLKLRGYDGIWKMRTGLPVDGCAIFWRTTRFELRHEEYIEFNKLGLRDNVAQICVLKSKNRHPAIDESTASPTSSSDANHVVICNIHVLYNPRRGEIKLGQARVLLDRAHAVSRMWNDAPVVVCGDFNCTPKSPLYNFISEQKLDVTGFPRDQISGQKTAEIYPPRTYYLNPEHGLQRTQSPNNFVGTSMLVDEKDIDMKHNHTPDTQNHYKPCSDMKNASSQEISSQPQNITPVLHMSEKSGSVGKCHDESKMIPHATMEETQQDLIDISRDKFVLTHDIPVGPSMDSPSNNQEEGVAAVDLENVAVQELIPEVTSSREDTTAHFIQESFYEHSQSNLCSNLANASLQNESVSDDMGKGSLELKESTPSTKVDVNCTEAGHNEKPVDAFISDIPSYDLVSETSSPEGVEVCVPGDFSSSMAANQERADPSTSSDSTIHVNISDASCVNLNLDQKLVDFSPDKFGEVTEKGHVGHYPGGTFTSDTSGTDDVSPFNGDSNSTFIRPESAEADQSSDKYSITTHTSDLPSPGTEVLNYVPPSMNSQPVNMERNAYDPSLWTPMEIETATGNAECTLVEHRLKLKSTYAEVEDYSETRDSSREPQVTSYHRRFMGTVDYIWCSEGLQTVKVLDTIPKRGMQWTPGFPTPKWGSDHIALVSQLAFKKGVDHS